MNIVLRADAKPGIGTGDLLSLLNLAKALRLKGISTTVATQDTAEARKILCNWPQPVWWLPPGISELDFQGRCLKLGIRRIVWEITEFSSNSIDYIQGIRHAGIIFEEMPPPSWDIVVCWDPIWCKRLLDAGVSSDLLGVEFVLLDPDVYREQWKNPRNPEMEKLLISMGGVDEKGYSIKALQALRHDGVDYLDISVLIGPGFSMRDELYMEISHWKKPPKILESVPLLYRILRDFDVVVSAGGLTASELVVTRTPAILIATVPHQIARCLDFSRNHWVVYAGEDLEGVSFPKLLGQVHTNQSFPDWSGKGAMALAERILEVDGRDSE